MDLGFAAAFFCILYSVNILVFDPFLSMQRTDTRGLAFFRLTVNALSLRAG